ncbi:MAG: hypothetical protein ABSC19_05675 [Syntrophorhabdales bacterium]|jgi:hypothetical protein
MIETSNFIFDRIQPMQDPVSENIPKETLLAMIRNLLRSDLDLTFLMKLEQREIEQLVAAIREGIDANR